MGRIQRLNRFLAAWQEDPAVLQRFIVYFQTHRFAISQSRGALCGAESPLSSDVVPVRVDLARAPGHSVVPGGAGLVDHAPGNENQEPLLMLQGRIV